MRIDDGNTSQVEMELIIKKIKGLQNYPSKLNQD